MNNEREQLISVLSGSIEALAATLPANTEAVLHDLTRPEASVISIVNGHVSGRKKGDALLAGPEEDDGFLGLLDEPKEGLSYQVFSGYFSTTAAGKKLSSSSTIYYDVNGNPVVAFCVNVDTEVAMRLKRDLDYLMSIPGMTETPETSPSALTEASVEELLSSLRPTGSESTKEFRLRAVKEAHAMGMFKIKGSVNQMAKVLGVTRYTIYNYLEKISEKE